MPTIKEVMAFFFKAMVEGYANINSFKVKVRQLPGYKFISFKEGKFELIDMWHTTPGSKKSSGMTKILYDRVVIWVMHYWGWYEESAIPFLKRTLLFNYENRVFEGGRGPRNREGEDHTLQYLNNVGKNDFTDFKGYERIFSTSHLSGKPVGEKFGEHDYCGMLTVDLPK